MLPYTEYSTCKHTHTHTHFPSRKPLMCDISGQYAAHGILVVWSLTVQIQESPPQNIFCLLYPLTEHLQLWSD